MKMKKRILVTAMAAVLTLSSTVSVMAAGSRNGNVSVAGGDKDKYAVSKTEEAEDYKTLQKEEPEVSKAIADVNKGTSDMKGFTKDLQKMLETAEGAAKESLEKVVESLKGKDFVTGFFDLSAKEGAEKNANGKYEVSLSVPAMTENTVEVEILHYSMERKLWETIKPSNVDKKNKTVTAEFQDFSPVAIIAKEGTFTSNEAGQAQGTSPKTEGTSTWMLWAAGAMLLGAAALTVSRRKYDK